MEYKRLTENLNVMCMHNHGKGKVLTLTNGEKTESQVIAEIVSDCREILAKIEQGKMIECEPNLIGHSIIGIHAFTDGTYQLDTDENIVIGFNKDEVVTWNDTHKFNDHFNKGLYFLDDTKGRYEAEKKLKELQK